MVLAGINMKKQRLPLISWQQKLASMGVDKSPAMEVIERSLGEKGKTIVSVYLRPRADRN